MANGDTTEQYEQNAVDGEKVVTCPIACISCGDDFNPWLAERMHVPAAFRGLLIRALADVAVEKRIVLESGAGIAVVFLSDPGQCLVFGLALREALRACSGESLRLRIGMHRGPVRVVRAADGEPQLLGDGLETGWRVASHAGPAQILATASFFDAIALQSSPYTDYFAPFGTMKDPSRCEQALYCLEGTVPGLHRAKDHVQIAGDEGRGAADKIGSLAAILGTHLLRRPAIATALAVAFVLVLAVVLRQAVQNEAVPVEARAQAANPSDQPPPLQQAAAPALQNKRTAPDHTPAGEPASQRTPTLQSRTATLASVNASAPGVATPPESVPAPPAGSDQLLPAAAEPSSETAQQAEPRTDARIARTAPLPVPARGQPVATGEVRFSIVPWGEIYLDGRRLGAAPPLRDIALQPGLHRIEVRNPGFASHSRIIEIRAGDAIRIRHRFE